MNSVSNIHSRFNKRMYAFVKIIERIYFDHQIVQLLLYIEPDHVCCFLPILTGTGV